MPTADPDRLLTARAARSLERSRARRAAEATRRDRRRRRARRLPGPGVALVLAASLVGVTGLGAATAHVRGAHAVASYRLGSSGQGVAAVQRALGLLAHGYYDARTRRAVMAFQRRKGLVVDGIAGLRTLRALGVRVPTRRAPRGGGSGSGSRSPAGILRRIALCESGGNPRAIGGGGRYRGKYQFTRATWRAMGGRGDPAAASEAEQDRIAARLLARRGPGAWPGCSRA